LTTLDTSPNTQALFLTILKREMEQARVLLELLQREFELLKSNPDKELENLLAQKSAQLKQVEKSVSAHHRFLQQQGLSSDRQGTERYLEQCPDNSTLTAAWQQQQELLQACSKQNEINGAAVASNQRQVNQALTLLLGMGDSQKTYGRSGESQPARPSKSLGKA
jgi:flagellar biosynthesis/type III secretory pathway chaperone